MIDKNNEDKRIVKTQHKLREAFATLLTEKPLNDISVKELTDEAGINRCTFYTHYNGIYDMAESIQNGIINEVKYIIGQFKANSIRDDLVKVLEAFNNYFCSAPAYIPLLRVNHRFVQEIRDVFMEKMMESYAEICKSDVAYYCDFVIAGYFAMIFRWIEEGKKMDTMELAFKMENISKCALEIML